MTDNQVKIQYLVRKLRYKYNKELESENAEVRKKAQREHDALSRILWYSYTITYGSNDDMLVITKGIEARKRKKNRYNKKIRSMLECYDNIYFITLTWNDDSLTRLKDNVRKKYVQRFLNECCNDYLANVDYGKKTNREHYHAVVAFKDGVLKQDKKKRPYIDLWKYGFSNVKTLGFTKDDIRRTSSYLLKLTNHAGKLGTGKAFSKKIAENVDTLPF